MPSKSYSQNGEDLIVAKQFADDFQGSVLEIGAWDPTDKSNSRLFIERGWEAVLVELSPLPLDKLLREYGLSAKVKVVAAAITSCDQHIKEFHITEDALSSDAPNTLARWTNMRESENYHGGFYAKLWVPSWPLSRLFEQFFGAKHPDVVSIDVEGSSATLCIDLLNLGPRPKCIVVEHDDRIIEITQVAERLGYVAVKHSQENLILVRQ